MTERWSLNSRLLVALVSLAAALFAGSAAQNYFAYREASSHLLDDSLRESAGLLMQLAEHEVAEHGQILGIALLRAETNPGPYGFRFQLWTPDMQKGQAAHAAAARPLAAFDAEGFGWTELEGQTWRTFALWNADRSLQLQIAQRQSLRQDESRHALWRLIGSFVVLLAIASLLIWWIVRASLRPLRETAASVEQRGEQDLRPVDDRGVPSEVMPLLGALNRLLERIGTTLAAERRFTADAAHELRTPLAAIRANAQVLVGARDDAERSSTAADLLVSVDRSTRLVDQLLSLARLDRPQVRQRFEVLDLATLALDQVEGHRAQARRLEIRLVTRCEPAPVRGDATLLAALLRNLVDNALRYGDVGGEVQVVTRVQGAQVELLVTDDGPGIPAEDRERVFERFHRLSDARSPGSGLGLSIARRIVEMHGGRIAIEDPPAGGGTCVHVWLPLASAQAEYLGGEAAEGATSVPPRQEPDLLRQA